MPNITLKPHQMRSMARISRNPATLDGSEMGCGKTATALMSVFNSGLRAVIVCPAYLRLNWLREVAKFFPELQAQIYGPRFKLMDSTRVVIMSYEASVGAEKLFKWAGYYIYDEAHYLATPNSQRTKAAIVAARTCKPERLLLLTGTPLKNKVPNLYSLLKLLSIVNKGTFNDIYKNYVSFCRFFTHEKIEKINGFIVSKYEGIRNEEALRELIKPYYFKNRLSDIEEIPDLSQHQIVLEGCDSKLNKCLEDEYQAYLRGGVVYEEDEALVGDHIMSAKARSALAKAPQVANFAQDMLLTGMKKLVIFSDHRASAQHIADKLTAYGVSVGLIMGGVSDKRRDNIVQAFQNEDLQVVVGTLGAMSTGVTLTATNVALINDLSWVHTTNAQARGRIHRISQKEKCLVYNFVCGSVDEQIARLLLEKERVSKIVMGG